MSDSNNSNNKINLKEHWNKVYSNNIEKKLGWYETDLSPMFRLINKTQLPKNASILNIGAGSTTLIDSLINFGYSNLIALDISEVALTNLIKRVGTSNISIIVDDLRQPKHLKNIKPVDLWIDRAVLHFFTSPKDQETYFNTLSKAIKTNGFVILAQFNSNSAKFCSGLPVFQYSKELLEKKMTPDFTLIDSFDYTFTMPSGDQREYIYTLFKKN